MSRGVTGLDHVALTVVDLDRAGEFYERVLGAELVAQYPPEGDALVRSYRLGDAVVNLHRQGNGVDLVARVPTPGSADFCLRWAGTAETAVAHLRARGVEVIEGPVPRVLADGRPGSSVYLRDPDGNLVELMSVARSPSAAAGVR